MSRFQFSGVVPGDGNDVLDRFTAAFDSAATIEGFQMSVGRDNVMVLNGDVRVDTMGNGSVSDTVRADDFQRRMRAIIAEERYSYSPRGVRSPFSPDMVLFRVVADDDRAKHRRATFQIAVRARDAFRVMDIREVADRISSHDFRIDGFAVGTDDPTSARFSLSSRYDERVDLLKVARFEQSLLDLNQVVGVAFDDAGANADNRGGALSAFRNDIRGDARTSRNGTNGDDRQNDQDRRADRDHDRSDRDQDRDADPDEAPSFVFVEALM